MRSTTMILIISLFNLGISGKAKESKSKPGNKVQTLLAVFAHPDDELLTGASLAHYATNGVKVYVAIATDGALGTTGFSNIPAGQRLVETRHQEMICSAKALGIEPPIFIGLPDQFGAAEGKLQLMLDALKQAVFSLVDSLKPDVIVTFGPEGWTGHPDHRLTGIMVTEVFASRKWPGNLKLYFSALPTGSVTDSSWAKYLTVDSSYLTVRVPLAAVDYAKLRVAFNCHQSQYRESVRQKLPVFQEQTQKRIAMFRPFCQEGIIRNSLFDND